jgi:hypothetical protein
MQITRVLLFSFFAILIVGLIVLFPFSLIWAVNNLFSLSIQYNLINWLSSLIIIILFGNTSKTIKIKKEKKSCCKEE